MEDLMAKVTLQMKTAVNGDAQKGTGAPLQSHTSESSGGEKNRTTENKCDRTSSFSILRSNVLQYVENGGWNAQHLKTTTCVPTSLHEDKNSRKRLDQCKPERVFSSHEERSAAAFSTKSPNQLFLRTGASKGHGISTVAAESHFQDLQLSSLSDAKCPFRIQGAQQNLIKSEKHRGFISCGVDAKFQDDYGQYPDDNNLTELMEFDKPQCAVDELSSLENSTDSSSSKCTSGSSEDMFLFIEEDPHIVSEENSVEYPNSNSEKRTSPSVSLNEKMAKISKNDTDIFNINSDVEDNGSLKSNDVSTCSSLESEGLSTYTLHPRWQEILPKEVIHRISRNSESNKNNLFYNSSATNISTISEEHYTDSERAFADDRRESGVQRGITTSNRVAECNSELCWSTRNVMIEGNGNHSQTGEKNEEYDAVKKKHPPRSSRENSSSSVDESPHKLNSIQDAYRNILKTISNVRDGTTTSPHFGKRTRRSRKTKKKAKTQPVYTCPKCQSSYLVSSKKAIAISRCLQCDLWTSVNVIEADEEEVSTSFCCLS